MYTLPFDKPGRFWRGNLHTHSTISDGHRTPEDVCRLYEECGYDFIALTDHLMKAFNWQIADTRPFRTDSFTTIIGAELHAPATEFGSLWHILAVGLPLDFGPNNEGETGITLAQRALDAGAFVAIAHPGWYSLTEADALSLGQVHAVEVFNGTSVDHNDRPDGWHLLDILTGRGLRYTACATDDAHFNPERADMGLGWVMVKSESLEPDALLTALKAGHYYSSTGPQIFDIQVYPGDKVVVRCSPAERVFVLGESYFAREAHGPGLTEVTLNISTMKTRYLRVIVRDQRGGRAWSNPIWLD